jgi:hypothetical protein
MSFDSPVVASAYIGPVAQASNVFTQISLNRPADANPCPGEDAVPQVLCAYSGIGGHARDLYSNWTSGVYVEDDDSLCIPAGGEGYNGPGFRFNFSGLNAGRWDIFSAIASQSVFTSGDPTDPQFDTTFDRTWDFFADGVGAFGHNYDEAEYLPSAWGGGSRGSVIFLQRDVCYKFQSTQRPARIDVATKQWHHASDGSVIDTTQLNTGGGNSWVRDANRRLFWGFSGGTTNLVNDRICFVVYADTSGIATTIGHYGMSDWVAPGYPTTRHAPDRTFALVVGSDNPTTGPTTIGPGNARFVMLGFDTNTPIAPRLLTWTGDEPYSCGGMGLLYCNDTGEFWAMPTTPFGHNSQEGDIFHSSPVDFLFRITPPSGNLFTGTWTITKVAVSGAVGYANTGMWKRFIYHKPTKSAIVSNDYFGQVYALRLA